MSNKKTTKAVVIVIGTILCLSTSVFGINGNTWTELRDKDEKIEEGSKQVIEAAKQQGENIPEKSNEQLLREQEIELYKQGYGFIDIGIAEELSNFCNKTPKELLELKGKTQYDIAGSSNENSFGIVDKSKTWEEIIKELNIVLKKPTESLGITNEQIMEMKEQGIKEEYIEVAAVLKFNYNKNYKEIADEFNKGKKLEEIEKQYKDEKENEAQKGIVSPEKAKENTEKTLKEQFGITEIEIEKSKKYGVVDIIDIALAKDVAKKNNVSFDKVLESKKKNKDWKKVVQDAEVIKNEK